MMSETKFLALSAGGIALIFAVFLVLGITVSRWECGSKASAMDMASKCSFSAGCMVQTRAGWRTIEAIREIDP